MKNIVFITIIIIIFGCREAINLDRKFDEKLYSYHLRELDNDYPDIFNGYSYLSLLEGMNNDEKLVITFRGKTYREVIPILVIEYEKLQKEEEKKRAFEEERKREEKAIYNKYINNSLPNGSTPYSYCYGVNKSCSSGDCSEIKVTTPNNSDVLVTIKKEDIVVRHAYIKAGKSYNFQLPNGTYQPFFYYGKGWNPNKFIKETTCGDLEGGFIDDESIGKDFPQKLKNQVLTYVLILQSNGNFSTEKSNKNEAF